MHEADTAIVEASMEDMDTVVDITTAGTAVRVPISAFILIAALAYGFRVSGDGTTGTAGYGSRATGDNSL